MTRISMYSVRAPGNDSRLPNFALGFRWPIKLIFSHKLLTTGNLLLISIAHLSAKWSTKMPEHLVSFSYATVCTAQRQKQVLYIHSRKAEAPPSPVTDPGVRRDRVDYIWQIHRTKRYSID